MTATNQKTDDSLARTMRDLGARARAAARTLARATSAQKDQALRSAAAAIRAGRAEIIAANARDMETARARSLSQRVARPAAARCRARGGHGAQHRRGDRAAGSRRPGDGRVVTAQWPQNSARASAARRHRYHLREPPQRDCGCRRPVPEVGQCSDPARRVGELSFQHGHPPVPAARPARRPGCPKMPSRWCRRRIAMPSVTCSATCRNSWTSSCPAAAAA